MAKQIIMYNLADHVTDEQYKEYVVNEKGPLLDSMPGAKKFEMVKITGSMSGDVPYRYVGIMHIEDMEKFMAIGGGHDANTRPPFNREGRRNSWAASSAF